MGKRQPTIELVAEGEPLGPSDGVWPAGMEVSEDPVAYWEATSRYLAVAQQKAMDAGFYRDVATLSIQTRKAREHLERARVEQREISANMDDGEILGRMCEAMHLLDAADLEVLQRGLTKAKKLKNGGRTDGTQGTKPGGPGAGGRKPSATR